MGQKGSYLCCDCMPDHDCSHKDQCLTHINHRAIYRKVFQAHKGVDEEAAKQWFNENHGINGWKIANYFFDQKGNYYTIVCTACSQCQNNKPIVEEDVEYKHKGWLL